jgi:hypothetical protein
MVASCCADWRGARPQEGVAVRARLTKLAGISALCVAVGTAIPTVAIAVPPPPVTLTCGASVSGPVTLSQDLVCSGDAITLLSGTLDLHHHTISGDGTGTGVAIGADTDVSPINATVENGTITGFATGMQSESTEGDQLSLLNMSITSSTDGIDGTGISGLDLDHVTMTNEPDIAIIANHTLVTVSHATITHSGLAFFIYSDGGVTASSLIVNDNVGAGSCSQGYFIAKNSQFARNASGLNLFQCEGSAFTDSMFLNNTGAAITESQGFDSYANPTLTISNDHFQNNDVALHLSDQAMAVVVSKSVFTLNGSGIVMDACAPQDAPCLPIVDLFSSNRFAQNHGNGVTWGDGTVTMTSNDFQNNSGWGFFASPGTTVVDGGANKALTNHAGDCNGGLVCS